MATLSDTTINGDLTLIKNGYILLFPYSGTWLEGFKNAPIVFTENNDDNDYYPWMIQKNTASATMFTVGTYQQYFVVAGSKTSRTTNGYDNALFFDTNSGDLKLNNKYLFLNSDNYNGYAPTKTGGGASGTWHINISGNAANLSSTLGISKGGTNNTSFTSNRLLYYNGSKILSASSLVVGSGKIEARTSGNTIARFYVQNNNNTADLRVTQNAGVYHANTKGSGTAKWLIYINTSGTVTANTSDRRKKFYIEDLSENETKVLLNTPIRNFIFKEDINKNNLEQNGIFAQDLREAMKANNIGNRPYLQWEYNDNDRDDVYYDINSPEKDDMTYSVSYNHMVPALIKGWQMQNKEIEELEKKLAILRIKKINELSS